jgi:pilus assembly protein CpaC
VSIEYKPFGTQLDFVPIVLGNGNIRLEVRPQVSEIDPTISVTLAGFTAPGLRTRIVDTGVEMRAGQTLAIAGLVQTRLEARNRGIPWLADLPYIGAGFRRVHEEVNEVELLVMVTPELAQAVDKCEAPRCFPGMHTDCPTDCELYWKGHIEVPSRGPCGPYGGGDCPAGYPTPPAGDFRGPYEEVPVQEAVPHPPVSRRDPTLTPPSASMPPDFDASKRPPGAGVASPTDSANRYNPNAGQSPRIGSRVKTTGGTPGFIGPIGYDVLN